MSGQLLVHKDFYSNGIEKIKLPGTPGYYLLHIISDQVNIAKKLVVQ